MKIINSKLKNLYELTKIRNKLRLEYGMPPEGYTCPICNGDAEHVKGRGNTKNGSWVLDHCHDTDTFRGWLCHKCNRALGGMDDDVPTLKRAIQYVEDHLGEIEKCQLISRYAPLLPSRNFPTVR